MRRPAPPSRWGGADEELKRLLKDVESALCGGPADIQRREDHDHVFFRGDEQAVLAAGVADFRSVVFVFDFDADRETFAADSAWPLKLI